MSVYVKQEAAFVVEKCPRTGVYSGYALGFPSLYATESTAEELIRNLQHLVDHAKPRMMKARKERKKDAENRRLIERGLREIGQLQKSYEYDADFIVTPKDGGTPFKVQIWGSMVFSENHRGARNIHIATCVDEEVFCYPHDRVLNAAYQKGVVCHSPSWQRMGYYTASKDICAKPSWSELLAPYRIYPPKP